MKWFNRTAQGFSPGNAGIRTRPERAAQWRKLSPHLRNKPAHLSVALSGRSHHVRSPTGLKPWAILSDHFVVKRIVATVNGHELTQMYAEIFERR
jgi:hypothetical protein